MSPFAIALTIHVLAAILGLGPVVAMAFTSARRPAEASLAEELRTLMLRLSTWTGLGLGTLLLSGVLIEAAAGGSFHETWWFRLSFLLLIVLGALNGQIRRRLRRLDKARAADALRAVSVPVWSMLAIIAVVTILMINRPW
jgi:hypothetical protein